MDVGGGRGEAMDASARGTWPMARRGSGAHRWFGLARAPPGSTRMVRDANTETRRRRAMRQRQLAQAQALAAAPSKSAGSTASSSSAGPAAALVCNFLDELQANS